MKYSYYCQSWNFCLALATLLQPTFSYVACYEKETCEVYGTDVHFMANVVKNGTLGSTKCKVVDGKAPIGCLLQNGTVIAGGATVPAGPCPDSPYMLRCTKDGMVFVSNKTSSAASNQTVCDSPFVQKTFGCIYLKTSGGMNFCQAEEFCISLGGGLMSPDTPEAFNEIALYLKNLGMSTPIWLGVRLVAPNVWRWYHSERDPGAPSSGDWATDEPNTNTQSPCGCALNWKNFRLGTQGCSSGYLPLCEKRLS
ncbi:C-type lectin-like [Trinorchestia longiramus]|nr:C-type lectin-like [Trinorchestia longiramus]